MGSVVEMAGVVKRFGAVTALDGLDFEVAAGEVLVVAAAALAALGYAGWRRRDLAV